MVVIVCGRCTMIPSPSIAPVIIVPVDHCWFSSALEALITHVVEESWLSADTVSRGLVGSRGADGFV